MHVDSYVIGKVEDRYESPTTISVTIINDNNNSLTNVTIRRMIEIKVR